MCMYTVFEALTRVACMKALPTDDELAYAAIHDEAVQTLSAGSVPDAGQYLLGMRDSNPEGYERWCAERTLRWDQEPREKPHRALNHLIELMVRTVRRTQSERRSAHTTRARASRWRVPSEDVGSPCVACVCPYFHERRSTGE